MLKNLVKTLNVNHLAHNVDKVLSVFEPPIIVLFANVQRYEITELFIRIVTLCRSLKGYIGSPYTECRPECYGDVDCPSNRPACFYGVCKNTCDGACGVGADCNLRGLTPVCSCPRDMTGDPFISCRPFTKGSL